MMRGCDRQGLFWVALWPYVKVLRHERARVSVCDRARNHTAGVSHGPEVKASNPVSPSVRRPAGNALLLLG